MGKKCYRMCALYIPSLCQYWTSNFWHFDPPISPSKDFVTMAISRNGMRWARLSFKEYKRRRRRLLRIPKLFAPIVKRSFKRRGFVAQKCDAFHVSVLLLIYCIQSLFLCLMGHSRPLFLYFCLLSTVDSKQMFYIKVCLWLDSIHRPLVSEATSLPTEQPQLFVVIQNFVKRQLLFIDQY